MLRWLPLSVYLTSNLLRSLNRSNAEGNGRPRKIGYVFVSVCTQLHQFTFGISPMITSMESMHEGVPFKHSVIRL